MTEHPKDWADAHINGASIREAADQVWSERRARPHAPDVSGKSWPILQPVGYGLIDEIAKLATRNSEADPNAVMGTALAYGAAPAAVAMRLRGQSDGQRSASKTSPRHASGA